jgi:hypothetical protein
MAIIKRLSKAEAIKQERRQLRGSLALDLADATVPFDNDAYSLLKFHGVYHCYDRDSAPERKQRGDDELWQLWCGPESLAAGLSPRSISRLTSWPISTPMARCALRRASASSSMAS